MGALTVQVIGDGSVGTKTKTVAPSDADINRLVTAFKSTLPGSPTVTDALLAYAAWVWSNTQNFVRDYERDQATKTITPIAGS